MNWLAHIRLAGPCGDDQLGGVLADLIPMNIVRSLSPGLQRGIALHHSVDAFTDSHPAVCASNRRLTSAGVGLRPAAAAIAVDMLYDHLLARDWLRCCPGTTLEACADRFYRLATSLDPLIPSHARDVMRYMRAGNWLVSYRELEGIRQALEGIRRRLSPRAAAVSPLAAATDVFLRDPPAFEADFSWFWPEAEAHAAARLAMREKQAGAPPDPP